MATRKVAPRGKAGAELDDEIKREGVTQALVLHPDVTTRETGDTPGREASERLAEAEQDVGRRGEPELPRAIHVVPLGVEVEGEGASAADAERPAAARSNIRDAVEDAGRWRGRIRCYGTVIGRKQQDPAGCCNEGE